MNYLEQVQRGIDFIENHVDGEFTMADVARHAGISNWHFQRIFKALTNETLKTYIRARRFAVALDALASTKKRVIDVALEAGFASQESFARAFRRAFGVTPTAYRQSPDCLAGPAKVEIDSEYLRHLNGNVSLEPKIVKWPEMRLVGMHTRMYGPESEKNNMGTKLTRLWSEFLPHVGKIQNQPTPGHGYGVVRQTGSGSGVLDYWAAVPVANQSVAPPGMATTVVPGSVYAVFVHRGSIRELDHTVNYIYSNWLMRSGFRHTYASDLECYDARYIPDSADSVMHYAIPIAAMTNDLGFEG